MLIKYTFSFEIEISKIIFIIAFFLPPFILNYYTFLKKKKYRKLLDEINITSKGFIYYMVIALLLFITTGYINIP